MNLQSTGPCNCFHCFPQSDSLTQLCLHSEHSQALMSCGNSSGSACCAGWGVSSRTFLTQEGRNQYSDRLFDGQWLVFSCCSSVILKQVILKEKNLAIQGVQNSSALEKPPWLESWKDLSLQRGGLQSASVGHCCPPLREHKIGGGGAGGPGKCYKMLDVPLCFSSQISPDFHLMACACQPLCPFRAASFCTAFTL